MSKIGRVLGSGVMAVMFVALVSGLDLSHAQTKWVTDGFKLKVASILGGLTQPLRSWDYSELHRLKKSASKEREPRSGKLIRWEGVLLSSFVDKALEALPLERRAQVDLVVLKNPSGMQALIPRSLIGKYPLLMALSTGPSSSSSECGPVCSVVPWSTRPKILQEELPVERYFLSNVDQIQLTSYRDQFGALYLKRRTDPLAIRGEKLFVQNCVNCHSGRDRTRSLQGVHLQIKHPTVQETARLKERDWKSIGRYLDAHHSENPSSDLREGTTQARRSN